MKQILKVLVGSQAHGLATPESDFDYRGVFVIPTEKILGIGCSKTTTNWNEGVNDDTSWEIGHFLNLATHCNPTILETFLAPTVKNTTWGTELRALFPYVWNSVDVKNAFIGYGINQRKKFFEDKDKRASKYAVAYLRTLYQAWELLTTGTFTVKIIDTPIGETLKQWKGTPSREMLDKYAGEVIKECIKWENKVREAFDKKPNKKSNLKPVNDFLLEVRREFWI